MYKAVIVDDEDIIANGLRTVLPWAKYNAEVVGMASSGEEGLKLIRETNPDILFTDIRMPGMDGLTMIAALKSQFPRLQITVLTGFRDFEYAQTAIKLGVTRFLLKPSKLDELYEALDAMTKALDALAPAAEEPEPAIDMTDEEALAAALETIPTQKEDGAHHSYIVQNALDYIDEMYDTHLTLLDVANHIYVSQWHLSKLLKKYTGSNFYDLLNHARIKAAKKLLKDPAVKVGDVALTVGFADTSHFSKVFKKLEGISANEYRASIEK